MSSQKKLVLVKNQSRHYRRTNPGQALFRVLFRRDGQEEFLGTLIMYEFDSQTFLEAIRKGDVHIENGHEEDHG